jgi:hypothetical protein
LINKDKRRFYVINIATILNTNVSMRITVPANYPITGFINPSVYLPKLITRPDIHSSAECLILFKNKIQGHDYISACSGYLCQVKLRNQDPVWFSEVGEVEVIGWMPMPLCNFKLNSFVKTSKIHQHLQNEKNLQKNEFDMSKFTSIKDGLPSVVEHKSLNVPPCIILKELKSTTGYDYFFTIGRWVPKNNQWYSEHHLGDVIGWLKMPDHSKLGLKYANWSL